MSTSVCFYLYPNGNDLNINKLHKAWETNTFIYLTMERQLIQQLGHLYCLQRHIGNTGSLKKQISQLM
jgi:hypothetical protein